MRGGQAHYEPDLRFYFGFIEKISAEKSALAEHQIASSFV